MLHRTNASILASTALLLIISNENQAYFGISVQQPLPECLSLSSPEDALCTFNENDDEGYGDSRSRQKEQTIDNVSRRRQLFDSINLSPRQMHICRRESGVASVLVEAVRLSAVQCQHQMRFERWNCSLDFTRVNILNKGFKETAFLYALSSASLVHSVSRACSAGHLAQCTCDESFDDAENRRTWMWGGCGDNVAFGLRFTRRFLQQKKRTHLDVRSLMDQHNSRAGTKVVRDLVRKVCKCHGVSGSCTMQTCWKQLSSFNAVGQQLKQRYSRAREARTGNDAHVGSSAYEEAQRNRRSGRRRSGSRRRYGHHFRRRSATSHRTRQKESRLSKSNGTASMTNGKRLRGHKLVWPGSDLGAKPKELVYLERSPDFCNAGTHSWGTSGRVCLRGQNCHDMCCGRGYNVQMRSTLSQCNCKVHWCCRVVCETCVINEEIRTCK